jgi:hypothetical protein
MYIRTLVGDTFSGVGGMEKWVDKKTELILILYGHPELQTYNLTEEALYRY